NKATYDKPRNGDLPGWAQTSFNEQASAATLAPFEQSLYLAKRFYDRPSTTVRKDNDGNLLSFLGPQKPTFDFHQRLALLYDHPIILRKLGLVIDVVVPAGITAPVQSSG